jgi:SAM-dependent methyltransferase
VVTLTEPYPPDFLNEQARNTKTIREYLYDKNHLSSCRYVIDIGCGEGEIAKELIKKANGFVIGLDIDPSMINVAVQDNHNRLQYIIADAHNLPLKTGTVEFSQFHFVLMWTQNPSLVLQEIKRVLLPKGVIIALESDYSGRIENLPSYHPSIPKSSSILVKNLKKIGADPFIGHKLPGLFHDIGFAQIQFGVLSWEYNQEMAQQSIQNDTQFTSESLTPYTEYGFTFTPVLWIVGVHQ